MFVEYAICNMANNFLFQTPSNYTELIVLVTVSQFIKHRAKARYNQFVLSYDRGWLFLMTWSNVTHLQTHSGVQVQSSQALAHKWTNSLS